MYCIKCGKEIDDTAKYCNECGHKVGNQLEQTETHLSGEQIGRTIENGKNMGLGILGEIYKNETSGYLCGRNCIKQKLPVIKDRSDSDTDGICFSGKCDQ